MTTRLPPFMADSMCAEPNHGPIRRGLRVRQRRALASHGAQERVDQVGMRAAVSAALGEREVLLAFIRAVDPLGGEPLDRPGEETGIIGDRGAPGDLGLGDRPLGRALGVDHRLLALDLLPFEGLLAAVSVEALAVLPRRVEEAPRDLGHDVRPLDGECGRLDGERAAVAADQVLADATRPVADDALRVLAQQGQAGAHAVGGIPHGREARPVVGPAVHVLLMAAPQELEPAQLALVVQLLDEQVFAAVHDGLHHHVDLAALPLGLDDLPALVDARAHRHGAGDVLARLEGRDRHPGVIRDRRIDVDGVDLGVLEHLLVVGVTGGDLVAIAAFIQALLVAAADAVHLRAGIVLIDGDELGAEAQSDDCHTDRFVVCHRRIPQELECATKGLAESRAR